MNQRQFDRRPSKPTANPRRVVGGFKLTAKKPGEAPWVIQRWMRLRRSRRSASRQRGVRRQKDPWLQELQCKIFV